jgi:prepilin-type N-terminal cleavage/methylation domain-containing protein
MQRGFTLMELLIVLAILVVLAGIVSLGVGGLVDRTSRRAMRVEWEIVTKAMEAHNAQTADSKSAPTIAPCTTPSVITGSQSATFRQYLRHDTEYYYLWEADGDNLVVQDTGTTLEGSLRYSSTGFYRHEAGQWMRQ